MDREHRCRTGRVWSLVCGLALLTALGGGSRATAQQPTETYPAFEAIWLDGTRKSATAIENWTGDGSQATLAGRKLFASPDYVQSLRNTTLPQRPATGPFIEFVQGDIFSGALVGRIPSADPAAEPVLLVRPEMPVDLRGADRRETISLRADWIRRIVWTRDAREQLRPATVFRRDGSSLEFQRLRYQPDGVQLLTDNQVVHCPWDELAEVHLPAVPWWNLYAREVAALSPDLQSPMIRLTTAAGTRMTTSGARFQLWNRSPQPTLADSHHVIQPAWSHDVLCLRRADVRQYLVTSPVSVPLSVIEPVRSVHQPVFSKLLNHWTRDGSARGGPLLSGGQEFRWGIGVCAGHELDFPLPASATQLTTGLGLDQAAGGGCIRGRVEWASGKSTDDRRVLYETEVLTGRGTNARTCSVELPGPEGDAATLRLIADAVTTDAPSTADPFDIRDFCDWLEPRLVLRPETWQTRVAAAVPASYAALSGWKIDGQLGRDWKPLTQWDAAARPYPAFRHEWVLPGFPVSLTRVLNVPRTGSLRWQIQMHRASRAAGCRLDLSVNQRPIIRQPLAELGGEGPPAPLTIDLAGYAGRQLQMELRLVPLAGETRIVFAGANFEATALPTNP
ncbi:MAG: NPCBM/NEW2 domain-containing protein [Planctomycetes bacterium]|nr:NPCBM/NEW2 domain-containing protein [Planctomycetota bacterium]